MFFLLQKRFFARVTTICARGSETKTWNWIAFSATCVTLIHITTIYATLNDVVIVRCIRNFDIFLQNPVSFFPVVISSHFGKLLFKLIFRSFRLGSNLHLSERQGLTKAWTVRALNSILLELDLPRDVVSNSISNDFFDLSHGEWLPRKMRAIAISFHELSPKEIQPTFNGFYPPNCRKNARIRLV